MKIHLVIMLLFISLNLSAEDQEKELFNFKKNTEKHYIKSGETLAKIALENKVSVAFLLYINDQISNPDLIMVGQKINIPNQKARDYVLQQSKKYSHLIEKMGSMSYKERSQTIKEMVQKDWLVIPILLEALEHKDVEVRENAKEALRIIHKKKVAFKNSLRQ